MKQPHIGLQMEACNYLLNATDCLLHAIADYNNPEIGYVERSFGELNRAWNALWIADVKSKNNNAKLFQKDLKTYGLEQFAIPSNAFHIDNPGIVPQLSSVFQKLYDRNSPLRSNYNLFYSLRNITQHDFLEAARGFHGEITFILNPFLVANIFNFFDAYIEIYESIIHDCNSHKVSLTKGRCVKNKLINPIFLKDLISIPVSLNKIQDENVLNKLDLMYKSKYRNYQSQRKSLRAHLTQEIINSQKYLSNNNKTHEDRLYPLDYLYTKTHGKDSYTELSEAKIDKLISDFPYSSLSEIAKHILGFNKSVLSGEEKKEIEAMRKSVQNIKESLIREQIKETEDSIKNGDKSYRETLYWKIAWGKTRYHKDFYKEVLRRLNSKK